MISRPNSRSCSTASIRSGIAGGLAGELGRLHSKPGGGCVTPNLDPVCRLTEERQAC
jgi:hypothetical protein